MQIFIQGTIENLTEASILQMIGRAGRPPYDTNGIAIILTQQKNVVSNCSN